MSDATPTPPADTRQQAAEAKRVWHAAEQNEVAELLVAAARGEYLPLSARYPMARAVLEAYGCAPSALASSSPALPEPPAPTEEDDGLWSWDCGHTSIETEAGGVYVTPRSPSLSPAEARLLASTLLAAADVAEEQQP